MAYDGIVARASEFRADYNFGCEMRWTSILILTVAGMAAQQPASQEPAEKVILENTGEPMRVPYACSEADIQAFGMTCTKLVPCPVYLELAAVETAGLRIFVTGNLHNASSTMYSILLASEDGGRTWFEAHERIRGAGLEHIVFHDLATGWISGQILGALPRDPFFLLTTDGGRHWRQRPVFSDTRVGAIVQFWFDTRDSGGLLIDRIQPGEAGTRYEFHETMTGGESWMVRELSSRPLRPKEARSPAANPDWRVRADGETKSYHVERRQGQEWMPVAAFLIQVMECEPIERPLPEPPKAEEPPTAPEGVYAPWGTKTPKKPPPLKKPRP